MLRRYSKAQITQERPSHCPKNAGRCPKNASQAILQLLEAGILTLGLKTQKMSLAKELEQIESTFAQALEHCFSRLDRSL
jgi:hypothetical protein